MVAQQHVEGGLERVDVLGRHRDPGARSLQVLGQRVAASGDHGQRRPEVVEDARAEGELGLDVIEVRADPDVGFQQVVLPVVVLDPTLVEEHVCPGESELVGQRTRLDRHPHLGHVRVGMLEPEEVEANFGDAGAQLVDRPQQGERIEPVVDPAAPQQDLVVRADPGHDPLQHRARVAGRRVAHAERHDGEQIVEGFVAFVGERVDATHRCELPEPEVSLLVARAHEEVAACKLTVQHPG